MIINRAEIINCLKSYEPDCDEALVNKAMDFAIKYHAHQKRESGDPYVEHPFEVAKIIAEMKLDTTSVIVALLHDTVEDTELTLDDIAKHFGSTVANIVDGVTKLTKLKFEPEHIKQVENFRKLLLAMSADIRVLLVKLADRLHNMQTIGFVKSVEKKRRIALETIEIYGPLAERIGMQDMKIKLQDAAFEILHQDIRNSIIHRLDELFNQCGPKIIDDISMEIVNTLREKNVNSEVFGRKKSPYSIWMKLKQKNTTFSQLADVIAFRVIVDSVEDCYRALGVIHTKWKIIPGEFQDFISIPKNNHYQSLHTLILGPSQHRIEIQIRTKEMNSIAEFGVAAHWKYKQNYYPDDSDKTFDWIRDLLYILSSSKNHAEVLNNAKLAMYYHQVFCFTLDGDLIALPKDATPVDFAYAIDVNIGNKCSMAKINGYFVSLDTKLNNGDQIEIVVDENQNPSESWEEFVITGRAKTEIRKFFDGINDGKESTKNQIHHQVKD